MFSTKCAHPICDGRCPYCTILYTEQVRKQQRELKGVSRDMERELRSLERDEKKLVRFYRVYG